MLPPIPTLRTILGRGLRKRCPQCGEGKVFKGWVRMHDNCGVCGLKLLRDQGDMMAFLVVVDRGVFIFPLIALIFIRIYMDYPVWFYLVVGIGLVLTFFLTMPIRNSIGLGLDYWSRRKWGDLSEAEKESAQPPVKN